MRSRAVSTVARQRYGLVVGLPVALGCWLLLKLGWRLRGPSTTGVACWLQRRVFNALTRRHEEAVVHVPVMFPGEQCAWPVEAGIVEPVLALWTLGVRTEGACQGHADSFAHIGLVDGDEFPAEVLQALEEAGVPYRLARHIITGNRALYPEDLADNERFCQALTAWARIVSARPQTP